MQIDGGTKRKARTRQRKVKGITTVVTPTVPSTSQEGNEVGMKGRMYKSRSDEK